VTGVVGEFVLDDITPSAGMTNQVGALSIVWTTIRSVMIQRHF
jgi:hypothetical protein